MTAVVWWLRAPEGGGVDRFGGRVPPEEWERVAFPVYGVSVVNSSSVDGDRDPVVTRARLFAPLSNPTPQPGDMFEIPALGGGLFEVVGEAIRWDKNPSVVKPRNLGLEVAVIRHRR